MILDVTFERTTYNDVPVRFEAGTPNIEGAVGLAAAIRWFTSLDLDALRVHESELTERLLRDLKTIDGMRVFGPQTSHAGIASFVIDGIHAQDLGTLLDEQGVAIRTGHHCTMPLMKRFGVTSTARASIAAYTTHDDLDVFSAALLRSVRLLR